MLNKKGLEKTIILSLMLATVGYGQVMAADYTNGTYNIGGTLVPTEQLVSSTGNVTLNATSDVVIDANNSYYQESDPGHFHDIIGVETEGSNVILNMNNHNLTTGNYGFLVANNIKDATVNINNAYDINATTKNSNLIISESGTGATVMQANHDINLNSSSAYPVVWCGVKSQSLGNGASVTLKAGNNVTLSAVSNTLTLIDNTSASKIDVIAGQNVVLNSSGTLANVYSAGSKVVMNITAQNGAINANSTGGSSGTIAANNSSTINLNAATGMTIGGNAKRALRGYNGGTINATTSSGIISLEATDTSANNNAGISATNKGAVNLHSDTSVKAVTTGVEADNGTVTFDKAVAISGATTAIAASNAGTVKAMNASSDKKITGNITSDGSGSSVDANFDTASSFLTGATTVSNSGAINLEFANGGVWNVTGDSSLTNLANNSTINMNYTGTKGETITTTNMSGNGNVNMNIDWNTNQGAKQATANSDYINVTGTGSGTQTISFDRDAAHLLSMEGGDKLYFATVASGDMSFNTTTNLVIPRTGKLYDYVYGLGSDADGAGKDWYIGLTGKQEGSTVGVIGDFTYDAYAMGTEMDRLNKRMGESRYLEEDGAGTWVRIKHGRWGDHDYSSKYTMFQLGYDNPYMAKDGAHRSGFAVDYTTNNVGIANGDGKNSRYAFSLYDTWNGDKKHYRDLVFRVGRINNDYTARNASGEEVDADFNNNFMSVSGEWGRRNDLKNNWYFEPQTQLQIARIDGADYTTSNGIKVSQNGDTSIIGRLGFRIGRELPKTKDNRISNVYFKADLLHEFKGSRGYTAYTGDGSESVDKDYAGHKTWMDVGVGADMSLGHNRHLWMDLERSFGSGLSATWQGNIGFRWDLDKRVQPVSTYVEAHPVEHVVPVKETYLDTVYFDFDVDQPKAGEQSKIEHFAQVAKANPDTTYAMVGNTDAVGTDAYNMDLSKRRVENVKNEAEKLGVPANRMQDSYLGKTHPAQSNDTEAGRAANRRVEIYEHKADTSTQN